VINGSAKAWVNFNGTGTVAIRASFNVSSITDNGTGNYSANFTNALPNANYAAVASIGADSGSTGNGLYAARQSDNSSTSLVQFLFGRPDNGALADGSIVNIVVFR
jgi:hypothetical protein